MGQGLSFEESEEEVFTGEVDLVVARSADVVQKVGYFASAPTRPPKISTNQFLGS